MLQLPQESEVLSIRGKNIQSGKILEYDGFFFFSRLDLKFFFYLIHKTSDSCAITP